jgi:hypothetical protein
MAIILSSGEPSYEDDLPELWRAQLRRLVFGERHDFGE